MLDLIVVMAIGCPAAQKAAQPIKADWQFHNLANVALVQQYAKVPQPEGVMIIDSRPYKPKYVSAESYYMLQDIKPELKKVFYLEAEVD